MKRNILLALLLIATVFVHAQKSAAKWTGSIGQQKAFIENKSQFDSKNKQAGGQILFGTDEGPAMIFFTKTGLTYRLQKIEPKLHTEEMERHARKRESEEEEHAVKTTTDIIHMQWENANPDAQVVAEEVLPNYSSYTFGKTNVSHVKEFKKLTYKNLYPGIDVVYVFDKRDGIKYSVVLHPGADVSNVKMKYTGNKKVSVDANGNVHIATVFGDIIDHAPDRVYSAGDKSNLSSGFVKTGNVISFQLADYDHSKEVVIDPWTTAPSMPATNTVYYIKSDSVGNAYVYGGTNPFRLIKYNPAGTLQWTYNSPWGGTSWFGALIVDRAGNSYITEGSDAALAKVNTSGSLVWSNTPTQGTLALEYWAMDFNCDQTQLFVGGTRDVPFSFSFYATIFKMNMTDGSINTYLNVEAPGLHIGGANEVRSMCSAPNASLYYLSLDSVGSVSQGLTGNNGQMSTYSFPYYLPYSNGNTGQGQNNIRANSSFLYTTDGATLHKRDLTTRNVISSVTIPGGSQYNNSGLALDSCGNVYVGSQSEVVKYDANLNMITSATTTAAVYDVSIGANGDILACGNGFAVALAMGACGQVTPICFIPFTATITPQNFCSQACAGSATANPINGIPPYTYSWSNTQTTQTINGLCAGTYSVTITDSLSATASATATVVQDTVHVNITTQPTGCGNGHGSAIANVTGGAGATFSWSNTATTQTISNVDSGSYSVTVTVPGGCSATATGIVHSTAGLALTTTTTPATCGNNNGTATVMASGGTGNYTYTWSNGNRSATISSLQADTFTVTVSDGANCSATASAIVATGGQLTLTLTALPASCGLANGGATVQTTGGVTPFTYSWSNGATTATILNVISASYSVTVTDNSGCSATSSIAVGDTGSFSLTIRATPASCGLANGTALVQANGGTPPLTYSWTNGATTAAVNNLASGPYTVTVSDSSHCSVTAEVAVNDTGGFTVTTSTTVALCGLANGTALVVANGGAPPLTYSWSNSATTAAITNLTAGLYVTTVTDSTGCRVTASAFVDSSSAPTVQITEDKPGICPGDTAHLCAPPGFLTYRWNEGDSTSCIIVTQAGTFWVTVSADSNCTAVSNQLSVALYPQPTVGITESGATLTATTTGATYQWYLNGLSITGATSQTYNANSAGLYMVVIIDTNGCHANDTLTYLKPNYAFPDAFTPNGDGKNDFFYPTIRGDVKVTTFRIYNRWGQLIYDDASDGWDGKFKGKEQPSGTYLYYAVLHVPDGTAPSGYTDVKKEGAVTLLR